MAHDDAPMPPSPTEKDGARRRNLPEGQATQTAKVNEQKTSGTFTLLAKPFTGFWHLFMRPRFMTHRITGLTFLVQYVAWAYLYFSDYARFLESPLIWTVPLTGLFQALNAAATFKFLPRKEDPSFAAVADKGPLSYYTVVENSFYAMQLLFVCCYLREDLRENIIRSPWISFTVARPSFGPLQGQDVKISPLELFYVFFVFYLRAVLWPVSRLSASLKNKDKNKSDKNRWKLIASTYAIKVFYIFAKHFLGFFPNYLIFLGRVNARDQQYLYGAQVLSAYASTISIFIHTLKFKGYIGPMTAVVAYDVIIPGFAYIFFNMRHILLGNLDVVLICFVGMILNLFPKPTWHMYQALACAVFLLGFVQKEPWMGSPFAEPV